MTGPYKVLDLEPSATWEQVKSAYKELAQICHPDKHANLSSSVQSRAHKKFYEINNAYQTIESNHNKRQELERKRREEEEKQKKEEEQQKAEEQKKEEEQKEEEQYEKRGNTFSSIQIFLNIIYVILFLLVLFYINTFYF